jgi:hypothetical protein
MSKWIKTYLHLCRNTVQMIAKVMDESVLQFILKSIQPKNVFSDGLSAQNSMAVTLRVKTSIALELI